MAGLLKKYLSAAESATRFVPTIAIQGSRFELDDVYEPTIIIRQEDDHSVEVVNFPVEVIGASSKIIVVDSAGMGKSTLSKYVIRKCLVELRFFPVLVELRRIKAGQSLSEFIALTMLGDQAPQEQKSILFNLISDGEFLFVFDGYDEVDESVKKQVSHSISDFSNRNQKCAFWLTSRPDAALKSFSGFQEYRIRPLDEERAYNLLRRYDKGRGKAQPLIEKISVMPQVKEFLGNPLLVTLLYKAYDYKATIPIKRNIFFRQVFDALYQDHDLSKEGAFDRRKLSSLDIEDFHKALRALGIVTFRSGKIQYSQEEFTQLLGAAQKLLPSIEIDLGKWRSDLLSAVPIFSKDGPEIKWSHKAFQDYFAAQFVCHDLGFRSVEFVKKIMTNDNMQASHNMLVFLSELDIELIRSAYIRADLSEKRARCISEFGEEASETDMLYMIANEYGEYFYINTFFYDQSMLSGFDNFTGFLDFCREKTGITLDFSDASIMRRRGRAVVAVFCDNRWASQRVLADIDKDAYPGSFAWMDSLKVAEKYADAAAELGWLHLNRAVRECGDIKVRDGLVQLMCSGIERVMPTLASASWILSNSEKTSRDQSIDDLLGGM